MSRVFTTVLLFTVLITNGFTKENGRFKKQDNDDRWSWGYVDIVDEPIVVATTIRPREVTMTTSTLAPETETEPEYCLPYDPPKPDFRKHARRISETKCYEYIWELNKRIELDKRYLKCLDYKRKKYSVEFAIGGFPTGAGDYPHMGAIGWKASVGTWVFKCGGSLISEKFILTAAHCSKASPRDSTIADPVPKIVRLGDKNIIDKVYLELPPTDLNITRIVIHPQYSSPKQYFDIALIELEKKVTFSRLLQPACLWPRDSTEGLGTKATLTGWGVVETGSLKISPELQAAVVDIIDSSQCDNLLRSSCNRNWCGLQDHQICAGKLAGGVDACQGDSGGPLQVKIPLPSTEEGQMHYVFGIISFGIGCAHPNVPGLYTRVSSFIGWIEDNVWGNEMK